MAETTKIQWTDHTFNPWIGCKKVSPGCAYCYAEVDNPARVSRAQGLELWGPPPKAVRRITGEAVWAQPFRWAREAILDGRPHRVFCASQSDVFENFSGKVTDHNGQPCSWCNSLDGARTALWDTIEGTPQLIWQLLTKRPENILGMVPAHWGDRWPENVWAMTSVENQEYADRRIPELLKVPAQFRGLSVEPLLGPIELFGDVLDTGERYGPVWTLDVMRRIGIHWVIIGGESGPHARVCRAEWVRDLVRQCRSAGVACFVKQLGARPDMGEDADPNERGSAESELHDPKGGDPSEWPKDLRVREFPC